VTAATHRPAARWTAVVRAESAALWRPRATLLTLGIIILATLGPFGGGEWDGPLSEVRNLAVLMCFFPLLHWRGRAGRGSLEQALPVDGARYDLVRVACGAAGALFTLVLATSANLLIVDGWYERMGGYPASYPFALIAVGMAFYLFGAAVMLRAERPGRLLLVLWIVLSLVFLRFGGSRGRTTTFAPDGRVTSQTVTVSLPLGTALLWLAASLVAVVLAVTVRGRGGVRSTSWPSFGSARTPLPRRPATAVLEGIRNPAAARVVAVRQLAVQAPRMAVPLLIAVLLGAWAAWRETGGSGTFLADHLPLMPFVYAGFFWPLLVWMDERRGDWDGMLPVDTFSRRLLHAAGGLVWLQAAVLIVVAGCIGGALAEGTIQSLAQVPAWAMPGVPLSVLALYCLGTAWTMLSAHPIRTALVGFLVTLQVLVVMDAIGNLQAGRSVWVPTGVFAPVNFGAPVQDHPMGATILWILVFGALAVFAIRRRVNRDLHRAAPLPAPAAPRTATA
jgi:hypothetical protein